MMCWKVQLSRKNRNNAHIPMSLEDILCQNALSHLKEVSSSYQAITLPTMINGQPVMQATDIETLIFSLDAHQITDNAICDDVAVLDEAEEDVAQLPNKRRRLHHVPPARDMVVQEQQDMEAEEVSQTMRCKILLKSIGRAKTISTFIGATGPKLEYDTFAITLHEIHSQDPGSLAISLKPQVCDNSKSSHCMVLSSMNLGASFAYAREHVHGWTHDSGQLALQYTLPFDSHDREDVHHAMLRLFSADAVPNATGLVNEPCDSGLWKDMLDFGYIEVVADGDGVRLTEKGMSECSHVTLHNVRKPLFAVREHLAIQDMTPLELACKLQSGGWQWQLMPVKIEDRQRLTYVIDESTLQFYTLGHTLLKDYCLCLLGAADLQTQFGTESVPHYCVHPTKDYKLILEGKPITPQVTRGRQRPLAITDEQLELEDDHVEQAGDQIMLAHEEPATFEEELGDLIEQAIAEEEEIRRLQAIEDVVEPDESAEPGDVPDDNVEPDAQAIEDVPVAIAPIPVRARGPRRRLKIIPWGCAEIAEREDPKPDGSIAFSFEARCRHHRYSKEFTKQNKHTHTQSTAKSNQVTMCKKAIPFTEDNRDHALAAAKWFLNSASTYTRQKLHRDCFKTLMEAPYLAEAELLRGQITEAPRNVKSDVDLDAAEAFEQQSLLDMVDAPQSADRPAQSSASVASSARGQRPKSKAKAKAARGAGRVSARHGSSQRSVRSSSSSSSSSSD